MLYECRSYFGELLNVIESKFNVPYLNKVFSKSNNLHILPAWSLCINELSIPISSTDLVSRYLCLHGLRYFWSLLVTFCKMVTGFTSL